MPKPIISLLTDLGSNDHYVGVMKAVIWKINPTVQIVDLCHEINPFDIVEAAFKLECSWRYFPIQSVHVCVVDPGVGSSRRPVLAVGETQYYIGPDNGIFSWVMQSDNVQRVYAIDASHYFLEKVSKTFHGRDIFAPCAAHLTKILEPSNFGDEVTDYKRFKLPVPEVESGKQIVGKIISIDRFGNCISNIPEDIITPFSDQFGADRLTVSIGENLVSGMSDSYNQNDNGTLLAIIGNAGYLELAASRGNAARDFKIRKNSDIILKPRQ